MMKHFFLNMLALLMLLLAVGCEKPQPTPEPEPMPTNNEFRFESVAVSHTDISLDIRPVADLCALYFSGGYPGCDPCRLGSVGAF